MVLCYPFSRAITSVSYVAQEYTADRLCECGRDPFWECTSEMGFVNDMMIEAKIWEKGPFSNGRRKGLTSSRAIQQSENRTKMKIGQRSREG